MKSRLTKQLPAAVGLPEVLRMVLQAVVDHVLHVLGNDHHCAVALAAINALGSVGFG